MKVDRVLKRYQAGQRNFSGVDLRGQSLKEQDLINADFSDADIRGTDFTGAMLRGASFRGATAGLKGSWVAILAIAAICAILLLGFFALLVLYMLQMPINYEESGAYPKVGSIYSYIIIVAVLVIVFGVTLVRDLVTGVSLGTLVGIAIGSMGWILTKTPLAIAGGLTASMTGIGITSVATVLTIANLVAGRKATDCAIAGLIIWGLFCTLGSASTVHPRVLMSAIVANLIGISVSVYVSWQALQGDERYSLIHQGAIAFCSLGGTRFCRADLTDADLSQATLKSADFRHAILIRTDFYRIKQRDRVRWGKTILNNLLVRELIVTRNGAGKSYVGCNLKGANLVGADLRDADLTAVELSDATLESACLERANLKKTQALATNFQQAQLTGACVEAWNIDSTTQLEGVNCDYIYLLNLQRERRPSRGNFAPGEFTKLFQEVLHTVDLIFRNGLDSKALLAAVRQVQVEQEGTELAIRSIENKGDGLVVVKVNVPAQGNKPEIHDRLTHHYELALQTLEAKYHAELKAKDEQISIYRQHSADFKELAQLLARRPEPRRETEGKVVLLKFGRGDFPIGFPVTLQIGTEGAIPSLELTGELPPAPELPQSYRQWQLAYRNSLSANCRISVPDTQVTHVSQRELIGECLATAAVFQKKFNSWLDSAQFRPLRERLLERLNPSDCIRLIVQTEDPWLRQVPWHLWDFCDRYPKAEFALSTPAYERVEADRAIAQSRIDHACREADPYGIADKIRILAILGNSTGINIERDRTILEQLPDAEVTFLVEPQRQELSDRLWEQPWDILFFAGHSAKGEIAINANESLTLSEFKHGLRRAIARGLELAIFNACDGLELAIDLATLHIPQTIVMREPVRDRVACTFFQHFLHSFSQGKSLYLSVREAREKLQGLEGEFPCATWLPAICQNPAAISSLSQKFRIFATRRQKKP